MGISKRFWILCAASAAAIGTSAACNDDDHTELCVGPNCPQYDGVGGDGNFFRSGDPEPSAGSAGASGDTGEIPDAGTDEVNPPDATPPPPDATTPAAPACELAFVAPTTGDAGDLTLDGSADIDGEACGSQFILSVGLSSNASSVTLFINDSPLATQDVVDGAVNFDAVLGNRGATANVLRAEAVMADSSTCSLTFPSNILVDCPGPSCSIESPLTNDGGYLNDSQDVDAASGFQVDIVVGTELENSGENVRLEIDGSFSSVPDAVVLEDNGAGSATFGNVTLAEGPRTVRAECSDAFGLTTLSPPTAWNVDTTPCDITISSVAGGADPITPGDDQDYGIAGIQVLADGQITGGDCKTLWIGVCNAALSALPLTLPPDGSFSLPVTLTGSTGSLDLCGVVEDFAGNMSAQDQITVNLRLDAPQVAIVTPVASTSFNLLGTSGATPDLNALTTSCEAAVVVNCTEVGQNVQLLADGNQIDQATCTAQGGLPSPFLGRATFAQASLPTKNDGAATLLTAQQSVNGLPAGVSAGVSVQADCEAPACALVSPSSSLTFLNAALDSDAAAGLQIDVDVQSEANSLGQNVSLIVDGDTNGALGAALVAQGGGTGASFADVGLGEGPITLEAQCADAAGNVSSSGTQGWTVDSVPCSANGIVVAGGASPIIPALDSNGGSLGLQVNMSGQATGGDCTTARVGVCGSLSGSFTPLALDQSFSLLEVTLASVTGSQNVCVEVTDTAGNLGLAQTSVAVRVDPPVVQILSPADLTTFNVASTCDTSVQVSCSDVGAPVQLLLDGTLSDTQPCSVTNDVTFTVALATKNDGSLTSITARQTADLLTSADASINVQADCEAPVLAFADPGCGDQLALAGDDVDGGTAGLQFDVSVLNDGAPDVTLTVTRGGIGVDSNATGDATTTNFPSSDLGGVGSVDLSVCATDDQGNQGCSASCTVTIAAEPTLSITSPAALATLSSSADCAGTPGLQVTVSGSTNAADGSQVVVQLGAGSPTAVSAASGAFSACVEALDGNAQTLAATVTDAVTTLAGTASIQVDVDTLAPGSSIAAPSPTVNGLTNRRRGTMELSWTSIVDSDGDPMVAYRMHCALSAITTEAQWTAGANVPVPTVPAATAGVTETDSIVGVVKPGMNRFCTLRGEDNVGLLSPIGSSLNVSNPFHSQRFAITDDAAANLFLSVDPLGDIDNDGIDDFAYGVVNSGVEIFLGKDQNTYDANPADTMSPDFAIRNTGAVGATLGFGTEVAGLGDINGDNRDDFAISARGANTVFVFFGRASNTWTNINLAAISPCPADLCIIGAGAGAGAGLFGWDIQSANFDGAGPMDLVISGRSIASVQANSGRVFVLLGGAQLATPGTTITVPAGNPDGFIIDPPVQRTAFGVSFAAVTGTGGVDDLVIGANAGFAGATTASAHRVTGRAHVGTGLTTITAPAEFENGPVGNYGNPVRALGDFNGDGRGDLAVGRNPNSGGIVNLYLGLPAGGFNNAAGNLLTFANESFPGFDDNHGQFTAQGFSPAFGTLGDIDQDGLSELWTGSTTPDVGSKGLGNLFYGSTTATSRTRASADFTYTPLNVQVVPNFVGDVAKDLTPLAPSFPDIALIDSGAGANVLFLLY